MLGIKSIENSTKISAFLICVMMIPVSGIAATVYTPMVQNLDGGAYSIFNISDLITTSPWVDARYYNGGALNSTTINAAITAIGSNFRTLLLAPGTWSVTSNITVPYNISLKFEQGAILSFSTGTTISIQGNLEAGLYKIFETNGNSGTVEIRYGQLTEIYPHWWGARHYQPSGTAINECLQAAKAVTSSVYPNGYGGMVVKLPTGYYPTTETIVIPPNVILEGEGLTNTVIRATSTSANPIVEFESTSSLSYSTVRDLCVDGYHYDIVGISFTDGADYPQHNFATIDRCLVMNCDATCVSVNPTSGKYIIYSEILDSEIRGSEIGVKLEYGVNAFRIERTRFGENLDTPIKFESNYYGDTVFINGNTIDGASTGNAIDIAVVNGHGTIAAMIVNNRIEDGCINFSSSYARGVVTGNQIGTDGPGVKISGRDCYVEGNYFINMGTTAVYAIQILSGAQSNYIGHNSYGNPNDNFPKRIDNQGVYTKIMPAFVGTSYAAGGTYEIGDMYWNSNPAAGTSPGAICTQAGTYGSYSTTGSISSGSTSLTVASTSGLCRGDYITIAGVSGVKKVLYYTGTTVTIDSAANASVSGAAVSLSVPVFKNMANLSN